MASHRDRKALVQRLTGAGWAEVESWWQEPAAKQRRREEELRRSLSAASTGSLGGRDCDNRRISPTGSQPSDTGSLSPASPQHTGLEPEPESELGSFALEPLVSNESQDEAAAAAASQPEELHEPELAVYEGGSSEVYSALAQRGSDDDGLDEVEEAGGEPIEEYHVTSPNTARDVAIAGRERRLEALYSRDA
eukprot:COSAG05_NODE_3042_length_2392_cov_29.968164_2_plen_193_part_00